MNMVISQISTYRLPGSPVITDDARFAGMESISEGHTEPNLEKIDGLENLIAFTQTLADTIGADAQPLLNRYDLCLANVPEKEMSSLVLVSRRSLRSAKVNSAEQIPRKFNSKIQ